MQSNIEETNKANIILEIQSLTKYFGNIRAVDNITFEVEKGDIFGFLGPNGAGKTTTIRIILGLINPDSGKVKINGYDNKKDFIQAIKGVGAVVETPNFYQYLTGYQNLKQIANLHPGITSSRIEEVLQIVNLKDRAHDKVGNYSLGMKQRLGIARALLNEPDLVILDEPTNGLDPQGMREIRELINTLAEKKNITFFISTHLLNEVEQVCNKVAILKNGKIIVSDFVEKLLNKNRETVEIITPEKDDAIAILKNEVNLNIEEETKRGVIIELEAGKSGEINKLLIEKGIIVEYLIPRNQSLEEYFINITQGDK